jgi:hypothetical protein
VFIAWSAHSDQFNYHGWVMAYDAATLQQTMIWSSAPDGTTFNGAGIWMAGRAPAIDADGNVYYSTGNGTWDGTTNFGESFVKFGPTPDAPLLDWFTPDDVNFLNDTDLDLGGSGPILIPGTDLILSGGKQGVFYLTHTTDMGHRTTNDVGIVQSFDNSNPAGSNNQIKGGPVYWNRDGGLGPWMYVWSDGCNYFNAYNFNGTTFDTTPPISHSTVLSQCGSSGGVLTLSANGSTPGSGIVWSSMVKSGDGNSNVHAGILRAFDADDLLTELWNSEQNHSRDDAGNWPKFSAPTVINGRVYLASFPIDGVADAPVNVYGLLAEPDFALAMTPDNPGVAPGSDATYTITTTAANGFSAPVHFDIEGLPSGATATFTPNDVAPPATTTLTVTADPTTPLGEYPIVVSAGGGTLDHTAAAGLYVTDVAPGNGAISIDFVGGGATFAATGVAGAVAKPNWNEAQNASGGSFALVDESGAPTGATMTWTATGVSSLGLGGLDPNFAMMNGYLDADPGSTTMVTIANLPPSPGGYVVYAYGDGTDLDGLDNTTQYVVTPDDGEGPISRTIVDPQGVTFNGTYVYAGNYTSFVIGGTGFTMAVTSIDSAATHAPLNGIQIVRGDRIFANGFDQ